MKSIILMTLCILLIGCAKYNTNYGRRGPEQPPVSAPPLPSPPQVAQDVPQLTFEAAQLDAVPQLVTPIVKSVWIMPHQTASGDFVGAYVLHVVVRPGDISESTQATVTRPPLPQREVVPALSSLPAAVESLTQAPFSKPSVLPQPQQVQERKDPSSILVEQGKKAAEALRQQLRNATEGISMNPSPEAMP